MKKKRIPLFSGYRRRRAAMTREEAQKMLNASLNKTMAQQRARLMKTAPKKETDETEAPKESES